MHFKESSFAIKNNSENITESITTVCSFFFSRGVYEAQLVYFISIFTFVFQIIFIFKSKKSPTKTFQDFCLVLCNFLFPILTLLSAPQNTILLLFFIYGEKIIHGFFQKKNNDDNLGFVLLYFGFGQVIYFMQVRHGTILHTNKQT